MKPVLDISPKYLSTTTVFVLHACPLLQQNSSELQLVAARTEDMLWWSQPRNPVFRLLLLLVIM